MIVLQQLDFLHPFSDCCQPIHPQGDVNLAGAHEATLWLEEIRVMMVVIVVVVEIVTTNSTIATAINTIVIVVVIIQRKLFL